MKFLIASTALAEAAGWAARFLPDRPTVPVLAGLLLTATNGTLTISASDCDTWARIRVPADIQQDGTAVVPGRMLAQITARLPTGDTQVSIDGETAELTCRRSRFTQLTLPAGEYPAPPAMPPAAGEVSARDFATAVGQVSAAASTDMAGRAELTAICADFDGTGLTLAATDGFRLAVRELAWQPTLDAPAGRVLIGARVLDAVAKTMTSDETLSFGLASSDGGTTPEVMGVRCAGRELITRLFAGNYPDYPTLLSRVFTARLRVDAGVLAEAVARVGITAERDTPVRLGLAPGDDSELTLAAGSGAEATGSDIIPASFDGSEPLTILLHPRRLLDALAPAGGGMACLAITSPDEPVLFTPDCEQPPVYRHLLCTLRAA